MIELGKAAKYLRSRLGLTQRAAARELGISHVYLSNLENAKSSPTAEMIDRYFETWGIDLYMLAAVKFDSDRRLPSSLEPVVNRLRQAWEVEIEKVLKSRGTEATGRCSTFEA